MKKEKLGLKHLGLILVILFIFAIMFVNIKGEDNPRTAQKQNYSPAYKLAAIQTNRQTGYSTPSQEMVNEFDSYLNKLVTKCRENDKSLISDYVVKSQELLKDDGINLQLSEIISGINDSVPDDIASSMSCAEIATAFVVLIVSE